MLTVDEPAPIRLRAVVVYESMFGTTRSIAEAAAEGLASVAAVEVVNVNRATVGLLDGIDLVVVGAPTHTHGLSSPASRKEATRWAEDPQRAVTLEPQAPGIGVREWLTGLISASRFHAAFDTRADAPRLLTGAAGQHISKTLVNRGSRPVVPVQSFLLSHGHLEGGETGHARVWGEYVGQSAVTLLRRAERVR